MARTMKFELEDRKYREKSTNCWLPFADLLSLHDSVSEDTQSKTLTSHNAKHLQLIPYTKHGFIYT